jgi:signal transduction histidine kinase
MLLVGYAIVFGVAALACFVTIGRARRIDDQDTRRGLVALLGTSGGWATAHFGFLLVPSPELKSVFYLAGLVIGFSTVGPWLYFCSAYTGRSLHRNVTIRRTAVVVFLVVVLVKFTNPLHHLYFRTTFVTSPFPHLAVQNGLFHWLVMGLSYVLASIGYFLLFELFMQVSYDTKPLAVLIGITGLPVILDIAGFASPILIDITYEPLGVAAFAVGIFFVYRHRFQAVQLAGGRDEPVVVLSDEQHIRDYNASASELFSESLSRDAVGQPLETVLPSVADALDTHTDVLEFEQHDTRRYYRLTNIPFGTGQTPFGGLLTLTDITHREQYRQELERQNERLEQFANMISHDLRNPLNVASGRLAVARKESDSDHLEAVANALTRMEELIEDVLTLARQGQPTDEVETIEVSSLANQCWQMVETADADLVIEDDLTVLGDPDRLQQLFENLFRNVIEHGGSDVKIRIGTVRGDTGFYVADDGPGIVQEDRERVFESGYSTAEDGTGFGLAIVKEIVDAHGWGIKITDSADKGARFEITDVDTE